MTLAQIDRHFEIIDGWEPGLRQCVHEYGFPIVWQCVSLGIRKPSTIHQLVREIWDGARNSRQGRPRCGMLDWLLVQAGAEITAPELVRVLRNSNLLIVPRCPTQEMIAASMSVLNDHSVLCTKRQKHEMRLRAALVEGNRYFETNIAKRAGRAA